MLIYNISGIFKEKKKKGKKNQHIRFNETHVVFCSDNSDSVKIMFPINKNFPSHFH